MNSIKDELNRIFNPLFYPYFIEERERKKFVIRSIALGILTLGIAHGIYFGVQALKYLYSSIQHIKAKSNLNEKTENLFQRITATHNQNQANALSESVILQNGPDIAKENATVFNLTKSEVKENILRDIPELNEWKLKENELTALGLLYYAMCDKNHPAFITEDLHPQFDEEAQKKDIALAIKVGNKPERAERLVKEMYENDYNPINRIKMLKQYMPKIQIETSSDEMMAIFNKYGIIQLRPVQTESLILGCGNEPANHVHFRDIPNESHSHKKANTINIHMDMNPSVIAFWGNLKNIQFFEQHKCRLIVDEGPICDFLAYKEHLDEFFDSCRKALKPNGYLALPRHIVKDPNSYFNVKGKLPSDFIPAVNIDHNILGQAISQCVYGVELFQYKPENSI